MSNLTKLFDYQGNKVTFKNENGVTYVNATQMAKAFGKLPKDYLKSQQAIELIAKISERTNVLSGDIVQVKKGGDLQGTWMHEDVALDFSQWLSIDFKLWCNDRIKELMTVGMTATPETLENMLTNPDLIIGLANQLKTERAEKDRLLQQNMLANQTIQLQAPKVEYHDKVLLSESTHTTTTIAKELGIGAKTLNKMLNGLKVQYNHAGQWLLYAKYQSKGFAKTRTHTYYDTEGKPKTSIQTVWTEKGREFIHNVINTGGGQQLNFSN